MTVYVPVLQARKSELIALGQLDLLAVPMVHPVLEAIYKPDKSLNYAVERLRQYAADGLLKGIVPAVDCVHLDRRYGQDRQVPLRMVSQAMAEIPRPMRPVLRVNAVTSPSTQSWHASREAADAHGEGVCVRVLLADDGQAAAVEIAKRVAAAANWLRCRPEQVDVLVDVGVIHERGQLPQKVRAASGVLDALAGGAWRTLAVAASAFPDSIKRVPLGGCMAFPRLDADLWRRLKAGSTEWAGRLGFGDYGSANTSLPRKGRANPNSNLDPNLRYAAQTCWHTYRYPPDANRGFSTFHDLCHAVTGTLWWSGEEFSWGDAQIALRARRQAGPGNAVGWRAFSLSHHLAVVLEELNGNAR